jgi:hypothetical protein
MIEAGGNRPWGQLAPQQRAQCPGAGMNDDGGPVGDAVLCAGWGRAIWRNIYRGVPAAGTGANFIIREICKAGAIYRPEIERRNRAHRRIRP